MTTVARTVFARIWAVMLATYCRAERSCPTFVTTEVLAVAGEMTLRFSRDQELALFDGWREPETWASRSASMTRRSNESCGTLNTFMGFLEPLP